MTDVTPATSLQKSKYLRLLVLGAPKVGKTTTVVSTSPKRVLIANSDMLADDALRSPARETPDFDSMTVHSRGHMEKFLQFAREKTKEGVYSTVVWDPMTHFSDNLAEECEAVNPDGRKFWEEYRKYLTNCIGRLFKLPAHVIVVSHFEDYNTSDEDAKKDKVWKPGGPGVVPGIFGKSRKRVASLFNDVVFMEKQGGKRVFVTEDAGVFGPGCRALKGVEVVDANIMTLITEMEKE